MNGQARKKDVKWMSQLWNIGSSLDQKGLIRSQTMRLYNEMPSITSCMKTATLQEEPYHHDHHWKNFLFVLWFSYCFGKYFFATHHHSTCTIWADVLVAYVSWFSDLLADRYHDNNAAVAVALGHHIDSRNKGSKQWHLGSSSSMCMHFFTLSHCCRIVGTFSSLMRKASVFQKENFNWGETESNPWMFKSVLAEWFCEHE